jgi:PAS domain S-box-containing protein
MTAATDSTRAAPSPWRRAEPALRWAILSGLLAVRVVGGEAAGGAGPGATPVLSGCEPDYPPYCFVTPDHRADGFSVELLRTALEAVGREVVFKTGPWADLKQELADGTLEVLPLVGRTPEREALYDFTVPYLTMHGALFIRNDTTDIQTWGDVKDKRVAVMKGDNAEEYVRRVRLSGRILTPPTFEDAFRMLADGRADAVIAQKLMGVALLRRMGVANIRVVGQPSEEYTQVFCFAVREGNKELLSLLNEGLSIVVARGTQRQLEHKWIGVDARASALARVVVYGGDRAFPPYEFLDEQGRPSGFNIELARAVGREIGADFSFHLAPWTEVRRRIENGELDLACMFYSAQRERLVDFSVPHTLVYQAVFARTDSPPYRHIDDLKGHRISVQNGDIMHDYALEHDLGGRLTVVATPEEALALLAKGQVDYALGSHLQGLYWIRKNGWKDLRAVEAHLYGTEYCYAVPKGNTALRDLFNDGLRKLKETGEYRDIYNKWLGVLEPDFTRRQIAHTLLLLSAVASLLAAIALAIIFGLRRQVADRTRALQQEMAQARVQIAAMEAAHEAIVITDRDGIALWINPAFTTLTGYTLADMLGRPASILAPGRQPDAAYRAIQETLSAGRAWRGELPNRRKDGSLYTEEITITPVRDRTGVITHQIAIKKDVTERNQMEAQLRQQQKLASIGTLARGMAHEVNNPLAGIMNYAQLIKDQGAANAPLATFADEIIAECRRVATITHGLLNFTDQQVAAPSAPIPTAELLGSILLAAGETARQRGIALSADIPAALPTLTYRRSQLGLAVTALLANAMEAWGEEPQHTGCVGGDRRIVISAREVTTRDQSCVNRGEASDRRWLRLTIEDSGPGIPMEIRDRVFDPFFTTKDRTRHSGLGLWVSRLIIEEKGGKLSVDGEAAAGTRVRVDLPATPAKEISHEPS